MPIIIRSEGFNVSSIWILPSDGSILSCYWVGMKSTSYSVLFFSKIFFSSVLWESRRVIWRICATKTSEMPSAQLYLKREMKTIRFSKSHPYHGVYKYICGSKREANEVLFRGWFFDLGQCYLIPSSERKGDDIPDYSGRTTNSICWVHSWISFIREYLRQVSIEEGKSGRVSQFTECQNNTEHALHLTNRVLRKQLPQKYQENFWNIDAMECSLINGRRSILQLSLRFVAWSDGT